VESRISSLESATEQTNRMIQDMMNMMQRFTKSEEKKEQSKLSEVTMTVDQYESNKPPRGEKEE
jgi:polyhydroxyalkanoate synthesis regulator phasin